MIAKESKLILIILWPAYTIGYLLLIVYPYTDKFTTNFDDWLLIPMLVGSFISAGTCIYFQEKQFKKERMNPK